MRQIIETIGVLMLISALSSIGADAFANARRDTAVTDQQVFELSGQDSQYQHGPHCIDSRSF